MVKTVAAGVGSLALWWIVIAILRGRQVAWLITGSLGLGFFLLFAALKLYGDYCHWASERKLSSMSPEEQEAELTKTFRELESFLKEEREDRRKARNLARVPWYWKALDGLFGLFFAFGPPVLLSIFRRQPPSWDSQVTGYHILAMGCGIGVYALGRAYMIRLWLRRQRPGGSK
jgi:hypothetical protein